MSKSEEKKLQLGYKFLGNTGIKVSEICLGAMTFGQKEFNHRGMPVSLEDESHQILDAFVQAGGNFIDTADVYGESEIVLGNWLSSRSKTNSRFRDSLVIATKVGIFIPSSKGLDAINDGGLSRKHILDHVERSLKRLQTSYIDLYQCHCVDFRANVREIVGTFHTLIQQGKVRYFGVSNWPSSLIQEAMDLCREKGFEPIVCQQPQYSLLCRSTEWEMIPTCIKHNIGIIPWSPLCGGWLAGRYKRDQKEFEAGSRIGWGEKANFTVFDYSSRASDERTWKVVDTVAAIAKEIGRTSAQVSLRWVMQREGVTAPIIGARTVKQLEDNLEAASFKLTQQQMERLDKASEIPLLYPYDVLLRAIRS